MKPRVLVVARWPVGGIRTFLKYVYRSRLVEEFSLTFAMPKYDEAVQLQDDLDGSGIEFEWLPADTKAFIVALRKLVADREFEMVHTHGFTALISSLFCRRGPVTFTTVHDVLLDNQLRGIKGKLKRRLLRYSLSRADVIHAVSEPCKDNLLEMLPGSASLSPKITVIRNGIESEPFRESQAIALRHQLDLPEDALVAGYFGRFMSQKGFRYVVEAVQQWRESTDRPLIIVAVGSGGFRAREVREIERLGLTAHFVIKDFVPNVASIMKGTDVVLMPSLWEACGLVSMEALVCGVPLICTRIPALEEITAGTPARLVEPRDARSLCRALLELDTRAERQRAEDYAETAARRFDVRVVTRRLADLYGTALA